MTRRFCAALMAALLLGGISYGQAATAEEDLGGVTQQTLESDVPLLFPWLTAKDHRHVLRAGGRVLYWGSHPEIVVQGDDYPVLSRALWRWSLAEKQAFESAAEESSENARDLMPSAPYYDYAVVDRWGRIDDAIVSFAVRYESYSGGAHPMHGMRTKNINPMTGEDVSIEEIAAGRDILFLALADAFRKQYPNREDALYREDIDDALSEFFGGDEWQEDITWMLDANNDLIVFFNPYEIGPYSSGSFELTVRRDAFPEAFRWHLED